MADAYRQRIDGAADTVGDPAAAMPVPVAPIATGQDRTGELPFPPADIDPTHNRNATVTHTP